MYVRTPYAAAWVDADGASIGPGHTVERPQSRPHREVRVLSARKPFKGSLGRYIAIKRIAGAGPGRKDLLLVAVADPTPGARGPWWVRAEEALTEREAARWARDGF